MNRFMYCTCFLGLDYGRVYRKCWHCIYCWLRSPVEIWFNMWHHWLFPRRLLEEATKRALMLQSECDDLRKRLAARGPYR